MVDARRVIAAKTEATYGQDAAPTLAADAVLTRNYSTKPVEVDRVQRPLDNQKYGATKTAPSNHRATSTYEVEVAGSGTAGQAPAWMRLNNACGMALPVIEAGVSATQKFAQPSEEPGSLTEYDWVDNQLRKKVGQRGTFRMMFNAGDYAYLTYDMLAMLPPNPRSVEVPQAADFSDWPEPLEVNDANTLLTLGGFAAITRSLEITANVGINLRSLIGARYVNRGNHAATGRLVVEAPSVAVRDYLADLATGDLLPLALTHGTEAGNIVQIAADAAEITDISEANEDDKLMFNIDLSFTTDGGADDLLITAR